MSEKNIYFHLYDLKEKLKNMSYDINFFIASMKVNKELENILSIIIKECNFVFDYDQSDITIEKQFETINGPKRLLITMNLDENLIVFTIDKKFTIKLRDYYDTDQWENLITFMKENYFDKII